MSRFQETIWCDHCGAEITWVPIVVGNHHFCCRDCLDGYRCECASFMELEDERRVIKANLESHTSYYN